MKKLIMTIAIVVGLCATSFANPNGGGLFQRGETTEQGNRQNDNTPMLPTHGETTNQDAPVGSGIAVLLGLGAAYLVGKKRREE